MRGRNFNIKYTNGTTYMNRNTSLPGNTQLDLSSWCVAGGWAWLRRLALLDAAVIAMAVGIFEAQAHLWTIFLQVEELLAVERSTTLPGR